MNICITLLIIYTFLKIEIQDQLFFVYLLVPLYTTDDGRLDRNMQRDCSTSLIDIFSLISFLFYGNQTNVSCKTIQDPGILYWTIEIWNNLSVLPTMWVQFVQP
jgi:hypothetical protein